MAGGSTDRGAPALPASVVQRPLARGTALVALARCVAATAGLLARRRVHLSRGLVGRRLRFADGTTARVYRVTVADAGTVRGPCVLVVGFRLRGVRGRGHAAFRAESLLNTPLFVGFPGFVSKLWLAHDENQRYRGVYDWDGAGRAESYARALWHVLALVSVPGSIGYTILPGVSRDELLADPGRVPETAAPGGAAGWWRVTGTG